MSYSDSKDKKLIASDEELMKKDDDVDGKINLSFFDNTIDESENEQMSKENGEKADLPSTSDSAMMKNDEHEHDNHVLTKANNKSFMEMEVKRDKMRWLYMSELGAIFGEEKHTRDSFIKFFGTRVSYKLQKN